MIRPRRPVFRQGAPLGFVNTNRPTGMSKMNTSCQIPAQRVLYVYTVLFCQPTMILSSTPGVSPPPKPPVAEPEALHPSLWRASQLARSGTRCVDTGHAALSGQLPGGGWPAGTLVELLQQQPGIGEMRLLRPALQACAERRIVLLQPPHPPQALALAALGLPPSQLLWLRTSRSADALWAAEQVLRSGSCGALLFWANHVRSCSNGKKISPSRQNVPFERSETQTPHITPIIFTMRLSQRHSAWFSSEKNHHQTRPTKNYFAELAVAVFWKKSCKALQHSKLQRVFLGSVDVLQGHRSQFLKPQVGAEL